MIMNERSGKAGGAGGQQYGGQQYGGGQQRAYSGANAALYSQVRQAINQGNLGLAEQLLQRSSARDAEWFYLMGTVYYRKGWYDEAMRAYTQACQMDPSNMEYRTALNNLNMSGGYGGYRAHAGGQHVRYVYAAGDLQLLYEHVLQRGLLIWERGILHGAAYSRRSHSCCFIWAGYRPMPRLRPASPRV